MLANEFLRVANDGLPAEGGPVALEDAFEAPGMLPTSAEMDLSLKGLSVEVRKRRTCGSRLACAVAHLDAIDIQPARDHGIPDYNALRKAYGLPLATAFADITSNPELQQALEVVYGDINRIDPFVGALAEDLLPGASVGPLVAAGYAIQFPPSGRRPLLV